MQQSCKFLQHFPASSCTVLRQRSVRVLNMVFHLDIRLGFAQTFAAKVM